MKKFLTVLASVGVLSTSAVTGLAGISQTNMSSPVSLLTDNSANHASVYNWENLTINHNIETKVLGADVKDSLMVDSKLTTESWDNYFKESRVLVVSGYFALHTFLNPVYLTNVLLYLNTEKSNDGLKVWEFEQINDQIGLLASQTSQIKLTVSASKSTQNITRLNVESYINAKTSLLSLHSCSTTSQITNIAFLSN